MMNYKGYIGHVEYSEEDQIFHGLVIGLKDVITFQGTTVAELEKAFKDSIDDYLDFCKKSKEKPVKSFSGTFNLRVSPELHAKLAFEAESLGISLNTYINETLTHIMSALSLLKATKH